MDVLRKMCNVLTDRHELVGDGGMEEFASLRFEAINGIVALRRRERKGVPRKRPEEFVEIAKRLRGKVDIYYTTPQSFLYLSTVS